jgi:hypothetical protein
MDPLVKKVFFILLIPIVLIGMVLALPHILVSEQELDPYEWFRLGTDSAIDQLWDSEAEKFGEMSENSTGYWVDDQAKMLWLMMKDPIGWDYYITKTLENLYSVWNQGYFPRRWVIIEPNVTSDDPTNVDVSNGFLRIMGDLTGENASNPIRVRYYEAAGFSDMFYIGGQMFIVDRQDQDYHMISYDPLHLRAEQCQNPGFDVWDPVWLNESMLLPWSFSYPEDWFYSSEPPLGCTFSARWTHEKPHTGLCIGFENYTIAQRDWRSSEFSVQGNTSYTFSFLYRGDYNSGGKFKAYLRWFDASHAFISQNYVEFNVTVDSWQTSSNVWTSPVNANYSDVLFWAESDSNGNYYFDDIALTNCTISNPHFDTADHLPFSTSTYHSNSRYIGRSAQFYNSYDYILQWIPVPVNVSQLYNFTFWAESAIPTTNLTVYAFYSDGTYTEVTRAIDSSDWKIFEVDPTELSLDKIVVALAFKTGTSGIDTYVDDVAVHYMPTDAAKTERVESYSDDYGDMTYVETIQTYEDLDVNFTITFRFTKDQNSIQQSMIYNNKGDYATLVYFNPALDGLSTVTSGVGSQETAYSSVWFPEVGRKYPTLGAYATTLLDPEDAVPWKTRGHNYYIVELQQIPEWAGCYGIAVKVPLDSFQSMITSNANTTSPYLHYLVSTYRYSVSASSSKNFTQQMICLNGYDFVHPTVYDSYLMNLERYSTIDLSMCYHIGTIIDALADYYSRAKNDPHGMGLKSWDYYREVFQGHNNGSYLLTTGKMMEASVIYYGQTGQAKFLDFAKELADYLVDLQIQTGIRNGTFPMKHNDVAYLDCQAACLIGLKLLRSYNVSYVDAYNKGLAAIHYDYEPEAYKKIIDPEDWGLTIPNIKRLFIYANTTHIDDDFFTFKSAYTVRACIGVDNSFAMLALSRVWRNVVWTNTNLTVYVCESVPGREYPGTREDWVSTNSETQPYGLVAWLEMAKYQRNAYEYYYEFLENHYAVENSSIGVIELNANITGPSSVGTISTFYLKGPNQHAVPNVIRVNSVGLLKLNNLESLCTSSRNCYYYDEENYTLTVKAFVVNGTTELYIQWETLPYELWMPIMPILGMAGFLFLCLAPVWAIQDFKKGRYFEGMAVPMILFLIGIGLVIGWLW